MYDLSDIVTTTYVEVDVMCLCILIALSLVTVGYYGKIGEKINGSVSRIALCYIIYIIMDIWWVTGEHNNSLSTFGFYFVNGMYYACLTTACTSWLLFVAKRLEFKWSTGKGFLIAVCIPAAVLYFLSVSAAFNGFLFFANSSMKYERGPLFSVFPVVNYGYAMISAAICLSKATDKNASDQRRLNAGAMALFSVPILIFGAVQSFTGFNVSSMGYTLAMLTLFSYKMIQMGISHRDAIESEEKKQAEQNSIIAVLNQDYEELVSVNFTTGKETVFKQNEAIRKDIDYGYKDTVYMTRLSKFADIFVLPADREEYLRVMDRENLIKCADEGKSCIVRFRSNYLGETQWYESKAVHQADSQNGSQVFILGLRNCNAEVIAEERRKKDRQKLAESKLLAERLDIIEILSENYTGLYYVNAEDGTCEVLSSIDSGKLRKSKTLDYESAVRVFNDYACRFVHPDDLSTINEINSLEKLRQILADKRKQSFYYRSKFDEGYKYCELMIARAETDSKTLKGIAIGFAEVDSRYRAEMDKARYQAVTMELSKDYDYVEYVSFKDNKNEDVAENIRENDRLRRLIPQWEKETNFHNRLNLIIDTLGFEPDKKKFFEQTRREVIIEHLKKEAAYYVYGRTLIDGVVSYYQIKFTADRDKDGNIVGTIVGMRQMDDSIRRELELREGVEKLVDIQTGQLREKNRTLANTNEAIIDILGNIVEGRDKGSGSHIHRVKRFTNILARRVMVDLKEYGLTPEKVDVITLVSPLHDIGKITIPDAILLKPGRLTAEEFAIMKSHSINGCEILSGLCGRWDDTYYKACMDVCRYHHERWDGKGYPEGLKGDDIPISAQIVSIADCYDALTTKRVYKDAYSASDAFDMIINGECGMFSPKLVSSLKKCREEFEAAVSITEEFFVRRDGTDSVNGRARAFENISVLLADGDPISRSISKEILEEEGAIVTEASDGIEAFGFASGYEFDLILMDTVMPRMSGIDAIQAIRELPHKSMTELPIITISSDITGIQIEECLKAGANECLGKPLNISLLSKTIISCLRENSIAMEKKLAYTIKLASTDSLTKVKSITAYTEKISELADKIKTDPGIKFGIVLCDINDLKNENDKNGHDCGDIYIKNCSKIICTVFAHSPVYRIGGDEFVVVLENSDYMNRDTLMAQMQSIVEKVSELQSVEDGKASFAAGIGVFDPNSDFTVGDVIKKADDAMYRNKKLMKSAF